MKATPEELLYLNFTKTFDLMRPDILANKLISLNVKQSIIRQSIKPPYLPTEHKELSGCISEVLKTKLSIPKDTISGPTLWKIYVGNLKPALITLKYAAGTTLYSNANESDAWFSIEQDMTAQSSPITKWKLL